LFVFVTLEKGKSFSGVFDSLAHSHTNRTTRATKTTQNLLTKTTAAGSWCPGGDFQSATAGRAKNLCPTGSTSAQGSDELS
jgi:hypothetical protein